MPTAPTARRRDPVEHLSLSFVASQGRVYHIPEQPLVAKLASHLGAAVGPPLEPGLPFSIQLNQSAVGLTLTETKDEVVLQTIDARPHGNGAGSKVMLALRDYCQQENKALRIVLIRNPEFFKRFDFLTEELGDLVYKPN